MQKELMMGNQAIALAAIDAGVTFVCGYPGTPSTEVVEAVYKNKTDDIYVEWSVNEKVALEVAAGAAYSGYRCLVTMKQVGLNACSDPAMNLSYIGVKGGLVLVVADDPGPISSQTEQDTRNFAIYSKLPLLDPSSPEEAYLMTQEAFNISEKYSTPVILRPTTRVCHSYAGIYRKKVNLTTMEKGFEKNNKWVCFPALSYLNHIKVEKRFDDLKKDFDLLPYYKPHGTGNILIIASGVNYAYAREAIDYLHLQEEQYILLEAATIPLPEHSIISLLGKVERVVVIEELDAVVERYIYYLYGKAGMSTHRIYGKLSKDVKVAGENTIDEIIHLFQKVFKLPEISVSESDTSEIIEVKKATLCAGCSHRAAFYAVKQAMKGRKAIFCGDIGCYTLGKAEPLNMVDTCLCMGAGITIGLGLQKVNPKDTVISFIGDSTFFHTGIQGVLNGIYNNGNLMIIILDNSSTAMTGGQPTPETGPIMCELPQIIKIEQVLFGLGVSNVSVVSPFDLQASIRIVKEMAELDGIRVIVFRSPCKIKQNSKYKVLLDKRICNGCGHCVKELGCPAMRMSDGIPKIEETECNGCGLCASICKRKAIVCTGGKNE
ncbi:indolepyruvate ferredoxin oxidoreductase subunit alpha [Lacrimispora sp. BS-2]|uniref:Indolepyruvate oxidoreductase subunit IorA n=1 Tax=Lacrimispora sp. BS-2 TaxID=3151850 RepID=A0AAU7PMD9_9FIRM